MIAIIAAQIMERATTTTQSSAGPAPNDLRVIPHIKTAMAMATKASSVKKLTDSMDRSVSIA